MRLESHAIYSFSSGCKPSSTLLEDNAPEPIVQAYRSQTAERKALLFTPTVAFAHTMVAAFNAAGIASEALDGATPLAARRDIRRRLHTGATRVVANCAVLTEGFDEPSVDCLIMARPTHSQPFYQQMLGRGTRPYPGIFRRPTLSMLINMWPPYSGSAI